MNDSRNTMKTIIVGLCFFGIGVGMLCSGINSLAMANRAKSWPTTRGTMKSSRCIHYHVMSEGSSYVTHAYYSYTVDGKVHNGDRIAFGYSGSRWRRPHQRIADRLSSARTVLVRYDPEKPSTAVLAYGLNGSTAMTLFSGGWLLLLAAVTVRHALRAQRKPAMFSRAFGSYHFECMFQGVAGIVLLAVAGLVISWIGGLLNGWGILSTLGTGAG